DEFHVAHLGAVAHVGAVRCLAHALLAAGHHDPRRAELDLLGAECHGAQARAAQLVHAPGRRIDRNAGADGRLPRRVLPGTGGEDLAHDHLRYLAGLDAGALERRLDGDLAELVGRQARQRAVEGPDWGTRGTGDDDCGLILVHAVLRR